ncbi:ABC transporter ATP-binding protein [Mycoplasma phocimorsus]|uniref:ABC transporter ATP-binding protein n=1 Tax=Mycoplasma phocimorsus TaxID=3045839 RepID=UPI0024C01BDD|nr:ABC transporter ATP-binding protein [Mycoplasma phocimorsus]MDJ1647799.1 ABC transporter ATP-binding protein [Mycoplasma phocimorsus]
MSKYISKKNFWGTIFRINKEVSRYGTPYWLGLFFGFLRAALFTSGTFLLGLITERFFKTKNNINLQENFLSQSKLFGFDISVEISFYILISILIAIFILYTISSVIQIKLMTNLGNKAVYNMRMKGFSNLQKMHIDYYDTTKNGELISRLSNDSNNAELALTQSLVFIPTSIFNFFLSFFFMLFLSVTATLIAVSIFALMISSAYFLLKHNITNRTINIQLFGEMTSHLEEYIANKNLINSFNQTENVIKKFEKINNKTYISNKKVYNYSNLTFPVYNISANVAIVAAIVFGVVCKIYNIPAYGIDITGAGKQATFGAGFLISFINLMWNFSSTVNDLIERANVIILGVASSKRLYELNDLKTPYYPLNYKLFPTNEDFTIEFDNVYFRYDKNIDHYETKGISFKVKKGQHIAIVGPTGCGKTTLINLLAKFYDIESGEIKVDKKKVIAGEIYINNIPYSQINSKNLRDNMSIVLQDTFLFNDTVKNNIKISNKNATDDEIQQAISITGIDDKINNLKNGLDTIIGEKYTSLSNGEGQLIDISRVLLVNKDIVIFDEATSNLDTETEQQVYKAMDSFMKNKTSFVIAHRLSTIIKADLIIVMNEGEIVERGTHKELLEKNGFYAQMYSTQINNILSVKE